MVRIAQDHSPTKDRLLDAAQRLMLAKGFAATTVDDICEAAQLTKGSFFHYFESKDALGKELLARFIAASQERLRQAGLTDQGDPLQRVYGHLDAMIAMTNDCTGAQGCLLGAFAQELCDTHPEIRALCAEAFGQWAERMRRDLDAAKAAHPPRVAFDSREVADYFIAVFEGAKVLAKANGDRRVEERSLRHFKRYVELLFGSASQKV